MMQAPITLPERYWLARQAYICVSEQHVVLLDLKADQYFALAPKTAAALAGHVVGWPSPESFGVFASLDSTIATRHIKVLSERGILVSDPMRGKPATPVVHAAPRRAAGCDYFSEKSVVSLRDILNMVRAYLIAAYQLRFWPMARIAAQRDLLDRAAEVEKALRLTAVFEHLRPLLYRSKEKCLFDSLALRTFLACYGVFPRWVFAVQAQPFVAHCWLQCGDVALNDRDEQAPGLTAIMTL